MHEQLVTQIEEDEVSLSQIERKIFCWRILINTFVITELSAISLALAVLNNHLNDELKN